LYQIEEISRRANTEKGDKMKTETIYQEIKTATSKAIDSMAPYKDTQPEMYEKYENRLNTLADMACNYWASAPEMHDAPDTKTYMQHWFRLDQKIFIHGDDKKLVPLIIKYLG
jgi:hypothetical protein